MNTFKNKAIIIAGLALTVSSFPACKAKKAVAAAPAPVEVKKQPAPVAAAPTPAPAPAPEPAPAPVVRKPNFNFSNIQFEFDSSILKTSSYPILDNAVQQMGLAPNAKFILNGYASAEGTDEHNMTLSVERANSVKVYLVNSGVNMANLTTKGNGEANPVADNTTEEGKILNRRVEIKLLP